MTRVEVEPKVLQWARKRARLSIGEMEKVFKSYRAWESGEQCPTLKQLEQVAKRTRTPMGLLFLRTPPVERLPLPDFRTIGDKAIGQPSADLVETVQTMLRRQGWMREFLIDDGAEKVDFVGSVSSSDSHESVVGNMRRALALSRDWSRHERNWEDARIRLIRAAEKARILVFVNGIVGNNTSRVLDVAEFRGFVLCDDYAPLIFLNAADSPTAQMFTLAHELAHVWLGKGGVFNLDETLPAQSKIERFCNGVAAEFLVPAADFLDCWETAKSNLDPFRAVSLRFKVSPLVAARRALDFHLIRRDEFSEFYKRVVVPNKKSSGGDFYRTQGVRLGFRFALAVNRAAKEGKLLYRDAYRLTDLHGSTFDKYVNSVIGD